MKVVFFSTTWNFTLCTCAFKDLKGPVNTFLELFLFIAPFYLVHYPVYSSCLGPLEIQSVSSQVCLTAGISLEFSFLHYSLVIFSSQKLVNCRAYIVCFSFQISQSCAAYCFLSETEIYEFLSLTESN